MKTKRDHYEQQKNKDVQAKECHDGPLQCIVQTHLKYKYWILTYNF